MQECRLKIVTVGSPEGTFIRTQNIYSCLVSCPYKSDPSAFSRLLRSPFQFFQRRSFRRPPRFPPAFLSYSYVFFLFPYVLSSVVSKISLSKVSQRIINYHSKRDNSDNHRVFQRCTSHFEISISIRYNIVKDHYLDKCLMTFWKNRRCLSIVKYCQENT